MPRPRPIVRARLAWLLSGLMLSVVAGDWRAARRQALDVLDLLQKVLDAQSQDQSQDRR